jgi:hypothetical protein
METTRGTAVAATRKVYAQITPTYERPLMEFQDTSGTFEPRRRVAAGRARVGFNAVDIATFEDLPWWLQMAVKGGVTGTSDGGTPPAYTYQFTPSMAVDDLKSFTLEFGETNNKYRSSQCMVNSITLRGDPDNDREPGWMIDAEIMARDLTTLTSFASLTDRTTEVILARGTKLYIDSAGGTIGTTQVQGKLINWSITITNNLMFKAFAEDVDFVAANKVGRGARLLDAQFTFEFDDDTEFANYRSSAPVMRMIRLERDGTQIHGSPNVNKRLRVDMYGYWSSWTRGNRDTNLTATFGFAGYVDGTANKSFEISVVNALATLP